MKDLSDWRAEIDALDRQLVELLNQRARSVLGLAPLKRARGVPVHEPNRERAVLENIAASNSGPLGNESLERIFEAVIREMRAMQRHQDD